MKELRSKICGRLFIANICSYVVFFILDVLLFNVERVKFTALYGYLLFPLFSIVCGLVSYKKTKQVILPNTLYFVCCLLFLIAFTGVGMLFQNDYYDLILSPTFRRALYTMPIIGFCTMISIVFSVGISIITSLIAKWILKDSGRRKM